MSPPPDLNQDVFDLMAPIGFHRDILFHSAFKEKLRAAGLDPLIRGAAPALIYLHRHGDSILSDIAKGCGQRAAALTWTAKQLEQSGLVIREQDSADKRFYHLELTELGEKYAAAAQEARDDVIKQLLGRMTRVQKSRLEELLQKVLDGLEDEN